jgi:hypothetical protein
LTQDQIEFVFWCLNHTPKISEQSVIIECNGKKVGVDNLALGVERISLEPVEYPRNKCPSIRLDWVRSKTLRNISFSTRDENTYLLEQGMGQEMVHVAGSIGKVGVNR